jgi:hypothetical protein
MAAAIALLLLLPGISAATPISIPGAISQYLSIRTPIDDLFTGAWQQMQNPIAAEQALNRDYEAGKQRLAAVFGAQRLIICNFPLLGSDQKPECINKLNESYQARLSELRRQLENERAKLAGRMF